MRAIPVLCATALVLELSACSPEPAPGPVLATPEPSPTAASAPAPLALDDEKVLNIYNWPDYIPPETIAAFEKETGIKINYDTYESNETMHAKVTAGNTGYDIAVTGNVFAKQQVEGGIMQPLDKSKLTGYGNLDKNLMAKLAQDDPGNTHLIPWAWGFTTVGFNKTQAEKALAGMPMPDNAWDLVFNPAYTRKLKSCGIAFQDSSTDVIPLALHHIGKNPDSGDAADLKAAGDMLAKVRRDIRLFSNGMIDDLASGKACVAIGWSSEINMAAARIKENGSSDVIEALIPRTGGIFFFDAMGILKEARHPKNALAFMDFYLRPQYAAAMTNDFNYPTGNTAATAFLKPEVLQNKSVSMSDADIQKLIFTGALSVAARSNMHQTFVAFKKTR